MGGHNKKTIVLTDKFLPNITDLDAVKKETRNILESVYNRFMNEANYNNLEKTRSALMQYRFIHKDWILPQGRYIRYISTKNPNNIVLRCGGFVLDCNKYIITIFNKYIGKHVVSRKENIIFMKLNADDIMRCSLLEEFIKD